MIKHDRHLRTRGKCRKQEPQASVFYISQVFSNDFKFFQVNLILEELPKNLVYSSVRSSLSSINTNFFCLTVFSQYFLNKLNYRLRFGKKDSNLFGNYKLLGKWLAWGKFEPPAKQREMSTCVTLTKAPHLFCCRDICQTKNDSKL